MELEQINLQKLKQLKGNPLREKIDEFQERKTELIQRYLELQDILDEYNQKMYHLSCEIEQVNMVLEQLQR